MDFKFLIVVEMNKTRGSQELLEDKHTAYEADLESLKSELGVSDVKEIIQKFLMMEEENFSLFNYVNELNNQIGTLSEEIAKIEGSIKKSSGDAEKVSERQRTKMTDLDHQIDKINNQSLEFTNQITFLNHNIDLVYGEVETLCKQLDLSTGADDGGSPLTDSEKKQSVLVKLKSVETKCNQLLMKNLIASLPKKFSSAATANDKDGDGEVDTMRDPAVVAAMIKNLQQGTASHEGLSINPIIGPGPSAPQAPIRFDADILSGYTLSQIITLSFAY